MTIMTTTTTTTLALASAALLLGCSEGVPPAAEGAFYLFIEAPGTCQTTVEQPRVGEPGTSGQQRVLRKDGVGGRIIDCTVKGSGPFEIDAHIEEGVNKLVIRGLTMAAASTKDNPSKGGVELTSDKTYGVGGYRSPDATPCDFYVLPGTQQQVASGVALMSFKCAQIENRQTSEPSICALGESTVAIQKCVEE